MAKRFSKNMMRRIALSGDVANAYALGRTMQEKHNHAVNASAVQIYSDGTRLHTLKSGSYRRLYATGGRERLWQQAGGMVFPWQMHFVVDAAGQCYVFELSVGSWAPVLEGVKMRAVVPVFGATLFLAEDGRLWGAGGWDDYGFLIADAQNVDVWPPQRITPYDDWAIISVKNSTDMTGVRRNGTLWTWGEEVQVDNETAPEQRSPDDPLEKIPGITDWVWCDSFLNQHSAMRKSGELWGWEDVIFAGVEASGPTARMLLGPDKKHIEAVHSWPYQMQYAYNTWYSLAIFDDGRLYYVGTVSIDGPEGLDTEIWTPVSDKKDWWFVEARDLRPAFAVDLSGDLYAYGDLFNIDDSFNNESGWGEFIIGGVVQIAVDDRTVAVLKKDGTLWGWGENDEGQLGLPASPIVYPPQQMGDASDWVWVDIDEDTTVAAKKNGDRYWCGDASGLDVLTRIEFDNG